MCKFSSLIKTLAVLFVLCPAFAATLGFDAAFVPTTIRHAAARAPTLRRRTNALSDDLDDAATRAAPPLSTIEHDLAVAQTTLDSVRLEDEHKAETFEDAEVSVSQFEDAEVNRFTAMHDGTTLSETYSRNTLATEDVAYNHGTAFDIDEYPLGVALHRPSARADDAYNTRIVALATPTGLPPEMFDVSKGHRGACSRRCTSFATCAGFAWKRAVREECVFFRAPDDVVAVDRAGELVPGGLPLEMNADWNWYAKPTQNSEVRQA